LETTKTAMHQSPVSYRRSALEYCSVLQSSLLQDITIASWASEFEHDGSAMAACKI